MNNTFDAFDQIGTYESDIFSRIDNIYDITRDNFLDISDYIKSR